MELTVLIVVLVIVVLAFRWWVLRHKLRQLEEQIAQLRVRVFRLERDEQRPFARPLRAEAEAPAFVPSAIQREMPAAVEEDATSVEIPGILRPARPSFNQRVRQYLGQEEWEALLGGSLLNKIGALVLVIGIALFLGYSFTHMTAAGRAFTSLAVSVGLLGGGALLERRASYRLFARGLIGAGWAALYVTAYAIYAVPAARLIESPYVGSCLLLLVAAGMIAHSLRYRVQAITGVAFFAAFAAVSVTPWSIFAVLSLIPLSAALLFLADQFDWNAMAVFGVAATYGAVIWRGSSDASLGAAESLLILYWLLFEAFDLLRFRRGTTGGGVEFVFGLNALGFLGLSYRVWSVHNPEGLWQGCMYGGGLYLASAIARYLLRRGDDASALQDLPSRIRAGSFEAPVTVSAGLSGLAIAGRAVGVWLGAGLAIEAEVLYVAGVFLNLRFLRGLAGTGFGLAVVRLLANDVRWDELFASSGLQSVEGWTAPALFQAVLYYVNRVLREPNRMFSWVASVLLALVVAQRLPNRLAGTGWLVLAVLLFEIGVRARRSEFRYQAYAIGASGVLATFWFSSPYAGLQAGMPLGCTLLLTYALIVRARVVKTEGELESKIFGVAAGAAVTVTAFLLEWKLAPEHYKGLFACVVPPLLFELGRRRLPAALVPFSYMAAPVAALILTGEGEAEFSKHGPAYVWVSYGVASLCFYVFSERAGGGKALIQIGASSLGLVFALCTFWVLFPDTFVAPAGAGLALVLFVIGRFRPKQHERLQAYAVMVAAVVQAWDLGFHLSSAIVAGACYAAQLVSPAGRHPAGAGLNGAGWMGAVDRHARVLWSVLGTFTLSALLWQEFPGGLLTTAWGIEGLSLLMTGFPLRERILRLEGLTMLLVCILKLFLYDLRNLETIYRILSFVALGVILLGVSSLYTRFRERVRQYL